MPVFFLTCGAVAILLIVQKLTAGDASLLEAILLSATMTYLGTLMAISAEEILPVVLILDPDGLTIERAFAVERLAWSEIERIDLTGAPGRLSDGVSTQAAARVGLGVFKTTARRDRVDQPERDADVIVVSAHASSAEDLVKVRTAVTTYRRHQDASRRLSDSSLGMSGLAPRTFGARA